eukprot:2370690-Rhodomonas_salina.1
MCGTGTDTNTACRRARLSASPTALPQVRLLLPRARCHTVVSRAHVACARCSARMEHRVPPHPHRRRPLPLLLLRPGRTTRPPRLPSLAIYF